MKHKPLWMASLSLFSLLIIGCFVVWKMDRLHGAAAQQNSSGCPVHASPVRDRF